MADSGVSSAPEGAQHFIAYGAFGVLTTAVNVATYWLASHMIGIPAVPASVIAWVAAVTFAYATNRRWVFGSSASGISEIAREAVAFFASRLATGVLDWVGMWLLVDLLYAPDLIVKFGLNIAVIILNYVLSKLVVFRKG